MVIETVWVNRTGIILNFLAGFLIAPELIGVARLKSAEISLETKLNNRKKKIEKKLNEYRIRAAVMLLEASFLETVPFILICTILMWAALGFFLFGTISSGWGEYSKGLAVGLAIISYIIFFSISMEEFKDYAMSVWPGYPIPIMVRVILWPYFCLIKNPIVIIFSTTHEVILPIPNFLFIIALQFLLKKVLNRLEGQERLRSMAVSVGILFYILGNMLQLLATMRD